MCRQNENGYPMNNEYLILIFFNYASKTLCKTQLYLMFYFRTYDTS